MRGKMFLWRAHNYSIILLWSRGTCFQSDDSDFVTSRYNRWHMVVYRDTQLCMTDPGEAHNCGTEPNIFYCKSGECSNFMVRYFISR